MPIPFGYQLRTGFPVGDLGRVIREWSPDVVHIHHPFPISIAGVVWSRLKRIPLVATNHTIPECSLYGMRESRFYQPLSNVMSFYIRMVLGRADVVTTPTPTAAAQLKALGFGKPVLPVSNGVDGDRFSPPQKPVKLDPPVVLYTGRLDAEKELDTLIEAVPYVHQETGARFRIGGEGSDRRRLEDLVARRGLQQFVEFTGYVSDEALPDVYREASVYAISSPVELQSISTLEAMACGLPIAAVDAGALPELVKPGINGYLAPRGDSRSFGEAIVRILNAEHGGQAMKAASRNLALQHGVSEMVSAYEDIFARLVCEHQYPNRHWNSLRPIPKFRRSTVKRRWRGRQRQRSQTRWLSLFPKAKASQVFSAIGRS